MPRKPAPCGTNAAYMRHVKKQEPIDAACKAAHAEYTRERRRQYAVEHGAPPAKVASESRKVRKEAAKQFEEPVRSFRPEKPDEVHAPPRANRENIFQFSRDSHIAVLQDTLEGLQEAYVRVLETMPDKVSPLVREIRAITAELNELTEPEDNAVEEVDPLAKFLESGSNVIGFPTTSNM